MMPADAARGALEQPEVHTHWLNDFYLDESREFYEMAFDHVFNVIGPTRPSSVLDAGCGSGSHTIRLALRGLPVVAVDFSNYILERARANVAAMRLDGLVRFEHANLTDLSMQDGAFDLVLCWNVLMAIPDVGKATAELCRVVAPYGFLVISEDNLWSVEALLVRGARRILGSSAIRSIVGRDFAPPIIAASGAEYWRQTDAGPPS
jgi:2-polyprenyl-3-methyl-5-hydroxy-6-metoxy-1,4-benzoquinol methylase